MDGSIIQGALMRLEPGEQDTILALAIMLAGKLGITLAEALELLAKLGLRLCGQRVIVRRNGAIGAIPYSRKESTLWQLETRSDENY
jgi:hypothetical protein